MADVNADAVELPEPEENYRYAWAKNNGLRLMQIKKKGGEVVKGDDGEPITQDDGALVYVRYKVESVEPAPEPTPRKMTERGGET